MGNNIALVLDQDFGSQLKELARKMPVWIISSEKNDVTIERVRADLLDACSITVLLMRGSETLQNIYLRALYSIDEHHGAHSEGVPYGAVQVFGISEDALAPEVMQELGFQYVTKTSSGFTIRK